MITMLDVAKCAGVSKSTVSRVLNDKNVVRKEIRDLVFKAIEETGYRPNLLAQQMATQKTSMIGLVITSDVYDGPFFSSMIYNASKYCEKYNHRLIFAEGKNSAEDEINAIDFLVGMKCAGIMLYSRYLNTKKLEDIIKSSPISIIALNQKLTTPTESYLFIDHYLGCVKMMDYLFSMGHRKIAFISGKNNSRSNTARQTAYLDKMTEQGFANCTDMIIQGTWSMQSGYDAAIELLNKGLTFSAILAGNDDMALGAIKALKENGKSIPENVSVAGIGNSKISNFFSPALTTIDVPLEEMFKRAVEMILNVPQSHEVPDLSGSLIIRESVYNITE